jgi:hypothetical protein
MVMINFDSGFKLSVVPVKSENGVIVMVAPPVWLTIDSYDANRKVVTYNGSEYNLSPSSTDTFYAVVQN